NVGPDTAVKTLIAQGAHGPLALLVRGDHTLNEIKAAKLPEADGELRLATDAEVRDATGASAGSVGPIGLNIPVIADRSVSVMADFICGANEDGFHLSGVNFGRDLPEPKVADLRNAVAGDPSPDGKGTLEVCRGIEVGHVFQLGTKYSDAMNARFLDKDGVAQPFEMGCYGIGVSRIVAATIEQNHDEKGIIWPRSMAPFLLVITPIGYHKGNVVRETADKLYRELTQSGMDVLLDDRDERPGVMFADAELIGIPYRLTIGDRGLKEGVLEYQGRRDVVAQKIPVGDAVDFLINQWRQEL
ncbi:MAG: proline--tRNA ligase, partial [Thiobacillaceae bacterium]